MSSRSISTSGYDGDSVPADSVPADAISADSIPAHPGELVPLEFEGVIRSVHPGVVNVELPDRSAPVESRYFVSLVTRPRDRTALSVFIDHPHGAGISGMSVGSRARGTSDGLLVAGLPPLRYVDCEGSTADRRSRDGCFTGRLLLPPATVTAIIAPDLQHALVRMLLGNPAFRRGLVPLLAPADTGGSEEPCVARARRILEPLGDSGATLRDGVPPGLTGGSRQSSSSDPALLIGLGPGFTPAGDDFIAGAILAEDLQAAAPLPMILNFSAAPRLDRAALHTALHRTTTGGATILKLALQGRPPLFVHTVCDILSRSDLSVEIRARRAASVAAGFGHSSGLDFLTGFLWRAGFRRSRYDRRKDDRRDNRQDRRHDGP